MYLAGGINGLNDAAANDWRDEATAQLRDLAEVRNPMDRDYRGVEHLNVNSIVLGDMDDLRHTDVVIANCPAPSWGTAMELMWYSQLAKRDKRVVSIVPAGKPISPWLQFVSDVVVNDLDTAIATVKEWIR